MKITQFKVAKFNDKWEAMLYYNGKGYRVAQSRHETVALFKGMIRWFMYNRREGK